MWIWCRLRRFSWRCLLQIRESRVCIAWTVPLNFNAWWWPLRLFTGCGRWEHVWRRKPQLQGSDCIHEVAKVNSDMSWWHRIEIDLETNKNHPIDLSKCVPSPVSNDESWVECRLAWYYPILSHLLRIILVIDNTVQIVNMTSIPYCRKEYNTSSAV